MATAYTHVVTESERMTTPNTILAGLTFPADTVRISLSDRHHDRAEAHGLKHVGGHGSRSIFEGAPAAWLAFLADTWEMRGAAKGPTKSSLTNAAQRVFYNLSAAAVADGDYRADARAFRARREAFQAL
jgi:hypothetical protein